MLNKFYKEYLLMILVIVLIFNYMDRFVLSLVLEQIKVDLALTDSQLGLLTGLAFALFYAIAGIPIARWADRGNRVTIITLTTGIWSLLVILCGQAASFMQLLVYRIGVGIGEAGCQPPAQSLIASYFNRHDRPRALSIFSMGTFISMVVAYLLGGWLADTVGWRLTFLLIGLPGIGLALLVKFTLHEPRVSGAERVEHRPVQPSYKEVVVTLTSQKTFRHITMVFCLSNFFYFGISQWLPTFFIRSHGMDLTELGAWMSLTLGVGGIIGVLLGGYWATRFAAGNESLQLRVIAVSHILYGLISVCVYLTAEKYLALGLMFPGAVLVAFSSGPMFAAILGLVKETMRATTLALLFFLANLIGLGLGPLGIGLISDGLSAAFGDDSLRYALLAFSPGYLWVAYHDWRASKTIAQDIQAVLDESANDESVIDNPSDSKPPNHNPSIPPKDADPRLGRL